MGGASFDPGHFASFTASHVAGKTTHQIFSATSLRDSLDPMRMKNMMRESCDDAVCPESTAIIVGLDETGSMHVIPKYMVDTGFPNLFEEIYDRKPVTNPHIMFMGIGDDKMDRHPMQISQFEAGMSLAPQLTDIYLEGNGGGNGTEGYTFAWYMAAMHTKIDCFEKRGKKGFLFTVGDEGPNMILRKSDIQRVVGTEVAADLTAQQLLDMVSRQYHIFHVMVEEGNHFRHYGKDVTRAWRNLLGERALLMSDYTKLSEVIVSAIQSVAGDSVDTIVKSWKDPGTRAVVARAIGDLAPTKSNSGGVVRF